MLKNKPIFQKINKRSKNENLDVTTEKFDFESQNKYIDIQMVQIDHYDEVNILAVQVSRKSNQNIYPIVRQNQFDINSEQCTKASFENLDSRIKQMNKQNKAKEAKKKVSNKEMKKNIGSVVCSNFIFCSQIPNSKILNNNSMNLLDFDKNIGNMDILLFKNFNTMSKMQRFLTGSDYDHVAVVVKIKQQTYILESSGRTNVCLFDFRKFITNLKNRYHLKQSQKYQLGYRRFRSQCYSQSELTRIQRKSQQFARKVIGKKYKFSPFYLISNEYEKKQETYFCSQLLAELMKYCNIVKFNKPTYSILPRDFSSRFINNEDEEMEINFSSQNENNNDFLEGIYEDIKTINLKPKTDSNKK